jgi:transglutaminase-like putative cysteine protease
MEIEPRPRAVRWVHDAFDNAVALVTFDTSRSELRFDIGFSADCVETPLHHGIDWAEYPFPFGYPSDEAAYLVPARAREEAVATVDEWAWQQVAELPGTADALMHLAAITAAIQSSFRYEVRAEKGVQPPSVTLVKRSGSCRDLAFFMLDVVRALGFAARYASGYLFVAQAPEQLGTPGGSTHAWLQVYLPGTGWVDFDPTNGLVGNRNLIAVGVAWHPKNVIPLWGNWVGTADAFRGMEVTVNVTEA